MEWGILEAHEKNTKDEIKANFKVSGKPNLLCM